MSAISPSNYQTEVDFSKLKILVIETNLLAGMDTLVKVQLRSIGINPENVAVTQSSAEALDIMGVDPSDQFDVLITNNRLGGSETGTSFIRDHNADFKVKILATGEAGEKERKIPGVDNAFVLPKPYAIDQLKNAIATGMQDRGAKRE